MDVIGGYHGDSRSSGQIRQTGEHDLLLRYALILYLEVEVASPEHFTVKPALLQGRIRLAVQDQPRYLSPHAARQGDQAAAVPAQQLVIDAGLVVKPFDVGKGGELEEILIALRVSGQQHDVMVAGGPLAAGLRKTRAGSHVEFRADYRFDPLSAALEVELERSEHVSMVRQGQGRHSQGLGFADQAFYRGGPVEQRKIRMGMEMYKL